jgi:hypothetical protein
MTQRSKSSFWIYIRLGVFILVPLVLLLLPGDRFDEGPPLCLSVLLFKQECYACGLTRAAQHLIHFQFEDAWYYNPLIFIVFPILAFQWAKWFWQDWKRLQLIRKSQSAT